MENNYNCFPSSIIVGYYAAHYYSGSSIICMLYMIMSSATYSSANMYRPTLQNINHTSTVQLYKKKEKSKLI